MSVLLGECLREDHKGRIYLETRMLLVNSVAKAQFTQVPQVNGKPEVKHGASLGESVNGSVGLEPRSLRS